MREDFVLLKRLKEVLATEGQWLRKTPRGDQSFKVRGRWSRWRMNPDRWVGGAEVLETHVSLEELSIRVGVFDPTKERTGRC